MNTGNPRASRSGMPEPRSFILVIDNRDSFVFNLVRYLEELRVPVLVREAEALTLDWIRACRPAGILLSPGPGHPSEATLCLDVVRRMSGEAPILGVCLGHQVIAHAFGAPVLEGDAPVHGRNADIHHDGQGVFSGLPSPFSATRYHSLVVAQTHPETGKACLPDCLAVSARTDGGVVMGVRHKTLPVEGVQFHPEAELTKQGHALLANFARCCGLQPSLIPGCGQRSSLLPGCGQRFDFHRSRKQQSDFVRSSGLRPMPLGLPNDGFQRLQVPRPVSESRLLALFRLLSSRFGTVFLDSAKRTPGMGEVSMLGWAPWMSLHQNGGRSVRRVYASEGQCLEQENLNTDLLTALASRLGLLGGAEQGSAGSAGFSGGAIGYLGYEAWNPVSWLPADSQNTDAMSRNGSHEEAPSVSAQASVPQAWFWFHRVVLVVDWAAGTAEWVVRMGATEVERERTHALLQEADRVLAQEEDERGTPQTAGHSLTLPSDWETRFRANFSPGSYRKAVEAMRQAIRRGDIYIANMTQQFTTCTEKTDLDVFESLRSGNPAAFSAFFPIGETTEARLRHKSINEANEYVEGGESVCTGSPDATLISASPERFLQVRAGWVETRPIKGTRPRGRTAEEDVILRMELEASGKDRAELLMITDLERNDLSRVCEPGSIQVTDLFHVDSLPTVHHLVATVRGRLAEGRTAVDCLKSCFPGGSITGAPKIRAMEVIRELEGIARGPYTGALGWLDVNGNADFSILIRTIVKQGERATFGVGGGITWDSDPQAEYEETLHKANALMHALVV